MQTGDPGLNMPEGANKTPNTSGKDSDNAINAPVENSSVARSFQSEVGDTLLSRASDLVSIQLKQLRELSAAARQLVEDTAKERQNLYQILEEITYGIRYLDTTEPSEKNRLLTHSRKAENPPIDTLSAAEKENRLRVLNEKQTKLEVRDSKLSILQNDLEDSSRRIELLIRHFEIAGSLLTKTGNSSINTAANRHSDPLEIALRTQMVLGQEDERGRLAREMHDGPAQVFSNVVMRLEHSSNLLRTNRSEVQKELENLSGVMRESLSEMRRFMFNLQPRTLLQHGLSRTLQEYCTDFANLYALEINLDLSDFSGLLEHNQEIAVFRIVQETLQNIRKHAEARKVHIYGTRDGDGLISIIIRDDGKGFQYQAVQLELNKSTGLSGMRERAAFAGGFLKIISAIGDGTQVILRIKPAGSGKKATENQ
ncbi:sensor histidine kinase [Candidatus Chlorohelix sp.]|uniref:sensor histidine kinase n=1 Tax=Candidatus Chlorohelix sp. TaxID=3139201 RepID=UPI00302CB8AC